MSKRFGEHIALSPDENITSTIAQLGAVARTDSCSADERKSPAPACCGYVIADAPGELPRFCDAPALRGSSYCAPHRALCQAAPGSAAASRIAAELVQAGGAVVHIWAEDVVAIPEPLDDSVDEALAEFDLPRYQPGAEDEL